MVEFCGACSDSLVLHGAAVSDPALQTRNLRTVSAMAGLFVLPLALSFILYFSGWRPPGQAAHGQLIDPPRPLAAVSLVPIGGAAPVRVFARRWTLAYVGDGSCAAQCRRALFVIRQSRLLLNQDMQRVARVFLATGHCCDREFLMREHPGLQAFDATLPEAQALLASFPTDGRETYVFIVDPLGNLVMRESAAADPKGLLDDLRKLLRLSHIG